MFVNKPTINVTINVRILLGLSLASLLAEEPKSEATRVTTIR